MTSNINSIIAIDDAEITDADLDRIADHADRTDAIGLMRSTWHRSVSNEHMSRKFRARLKRRFLNLRERLREERLAEEHDRFIRPMLEAENLATLLDLLNRDSQRAGENEWFSIPFARAFEPRGFKAPIHRLPVFSKTVRDVVVPAYPEGEILHTIEVGRHTVVSYDDANVIVRPFEGEEYIMLPRDIEAEMYLAVGKFIDAEFPHRDLEFDDSDFEIFDGDDGEGEVTFDLKLKFRRRAWRETYVDDAPTGDGRWVTLSDSATLTARYDGEWTVDYYDPGVSYREDFQRGCYVRC